MHSNRPPLWVFLFALILGFVIYELFVVDEPAEPETPAAVTAVAPVPEALLDSVRDTLMPTSRNIDCLTDDLYLTCFFSHDVLQQIERLQDHDTMPFTPDLGSETPAATPDDAASAEAHHDE